MTWFTSNTTTVLQKNYLPHNVARSREGGGKLCLFASYHNSKCLPYYVSFYLGKLRDLGFDIVFVSTAPKISNEDYEKLNNYCILTIHRKNLGYDFYSWKTGLKHFKKFYQLSDYQKLLFTNDSIVGPLFPLGPNLAQADQAPTKFWGMTDSHETGTHHIQSYFMYFDQQIFTCSAFTKFWDQVAVLSDKDKIIRRYEIGLSKTLAEAGLDLAALFPQQQSQQRAVELGNKFQYAARINRYAMNSTLFMWDILIRDFNFPFIKTEVMTKNRFDSDSLPDLKELVREAEPDAIENLDRFFSEFAWSCNRNPPKAGVITSLRQKLLVYANQNKHWLPTLLHRLYHCLKKP